MDNTSNTTFIYNVVVAMGCNCEPDRPNQKKINSTASVSTDQKQESGAPKGIKAREDLRSALRVNLRPMDYELTDRGQIPPISMDQKTNSLWVSGRKST